MAYPKVKSLLEAAASLFDPAQGSARDMRRRLRLLAEPSLDGLLSPLIVQAAVTAPSLDVLLGCAPYEELVEASRRGKVDIAFHLGGPIAELDCSHVWREPLHLVASARHPLARERVVTPAQLRDHSLVLPPEGSQVRRLVLAELERIGCRDLLCVPVTASNDHIVREAVLLGIAIAPCFGRSLQADLEAQRLVTLPVTGAEMGLDVRIGLAAGLGSDAAVAALARFLAVESGRLAHESGQRRVIGSPIADCAA